MSPYAEEIKKQDIIDQLTWDDSVNANEIYINVRDNTVQLKGTVPNYTAKMAAERDALQVAGVVRVENFLEIEFPPSVTVPGDEEITSNVNYMLVWNSRIDSSHIQVNTQQGIVTLTGEVFSYWEKYLAGELAISTAGVIEVINNLKVKPKKTVIDMDIEKDIKNTYQRSALIDQEKIQVSVKDGIVHLSGVVSNQLIKQRAHEIAMYTAGVVDVVDEITVG